MEKKIIDIIIPTYKPDEKFKLLIRRLQQQSYPIHRIYVMNTLTDTFPEEFCKEYGNLEITHIQPEAFDHGGTRHQGALQSNADIMVYLTQDAVPCNPQLIEELVKPFEDELVGVVYGRQLPNPTCGVIESYTREFNYPNVSRVKSNQDLPELGIKTFFCSNVCAAYRREIYNLMGGFTRKTIFNEDMILAGTMVRAGYKVAYAASAKVIHSHNYGCLEQLKRNFDLAVSQTQHSEVFEGIKSETEGIRLVKKTIQYLCKIRKPWLVIVLIAQSGCKYIGYRLGRNYQKLPQWVVNKCTMNPRYWK
ncbi:MAG: glycosyltransferase family 2 protein [Lachnospiraceae bacterium]